MRTFAGYVLCRGVAASNVSIIFGLIDIDCSRFFTVTPNETTRGHAYKLFVHHSRVDIRKHFFCNRIVKVWNSLPAAADDFATVRSFTYVTYWASGPLWIPGILTWYFVFQCHNKLFTYEYTAAFVLSFLCFICFYCIAITTLSCMLLWCL